MSLAGLELCPQLTGLTLHVRRPMVDHIGQSLHVTYLHSSLLAYVIVSSLVFQV